MNDQEKTMAEISRQHYISLWKLTTDGDKFYTNCSLLQPVIYKGNKAILKIPMEAEERQGSLMMAWFNGDGAAKVFAYTHNALLLERLSGSHPTLTEMVNAGQDIEASRIICAVLKKLHAPRLQKPRFKLITLDEWFADLWPAAVKYGGVIAQCAQLARIQLNTRHEVTILHGDVHHQNILYDDTRGWLVIDPKRLIGDRAFDYANIFCNPDNETVLRPGRFEQQLEMISTLAGIDRTHLLKWVIAWCGLSASWILNDPHPGETADSDLGLAQIALSLLKTFKDPIT
ncbi:aminoglycoside phosphotransferase family protein [Pedobacter sp.]|uniref:aminoglycoside phosphotransferase family protein n=1 Tax=Pedobacter sp. TaxID=1411316 RepID=UPI0031DACB23